MANPFQTPFDVAAVLAVLNNNAKMAAVVSAVGAVSMTMANPPTHATFDAAFSAAYNAAITAGLDTNEATAVANAAAAAYAAAINSGKIAAQASVAAYAAAMAALGAFHGAGTGTPFLWVAEIAAFAAALALNLGLNNDSTQSASNADGKAYINYLLSLI